MMGKELLMIPGPIPVSDDVLAEMSKPMFSHRGARFESMFSDITTGVSKLLDASGRVFTLTCSGTGGNEAAIANLVAPNDRVVCCVNGWFGARFKDTVKVYTDNIVDVTSELGRAINLADLEAKIKGASVVTCVFNETSTGIVNPIREIGRICSENGTLLVVDNVSGIGNRFSMDKWNVDAVVTATQKAMGAPPGMAFVAMSDHAWQKVLNTPRRSYYFDLMTYEKFLLKNQTPFTPSISVMLAIRKSLANILSEGVDNFVDRHTRCAEAVRQGVEALGLELFADRRSASNTVTAIRAEGFAENVLKTMKEKYGIVIADGQAQLKGKIFRIGHMGVTDHKDILATMGALELTLKEIGRDVELGRGVAAAETVFSK